jgi:chromosome segregation ATPase
MAEKKKDILTEKTLKLYPDTLENFNRILAESESKSVNQFVETLLDRYENPRKIDENNEKELIKTQQELAKAQEKICALEQKLAENSNWETKLSEADNQHKAEIDALRKEIFLLKSNLNDAENDVKTLSNNKIDISQLNMEVLKYVAKREAGNRKYAVTISDIINFFIQKRFIKGELNGGLDSVPNNEIEKIKKQLNS